MRVFCDSETTMGPSQQSRTTGLKCAEKQFTGFTSPESMGDANDYPATGKTKVNSKEGREDPVDRSTTCV